MTHSRRCQITRSKPFCLYCRNPHFKPPFTSPFYVMNIDSTVSKESFHVPCRWSTAQRQELSARCLENPDCDHHEKDFIVVMIISPVAPEILTPLGNGACNKKSVSGTGHMYSFRNGVPNLFIQNQCLS